MECESYLKSFYGTIYLCILRKYYDSVFYSPTYIFDIMQPDLYNPPNHNIFKLIIYNADMTIMAP